MYQIALDSFLVLTSFVLLWFGADRLVESAARVGRKFGMSDLVIGLTIVAFGTSAPEFAVTISATILGQSDLSIGNIVGSNIFNLGFILGGCAIIKPLTTSHKLVYRDGAVLILTSLLLVVMLHDLHLSRWEGILLFAGLVLYITSLFLSKPSLEEEIPTGTATGKDYIMILLGIGLVIGGGQLLVYSASSLALALGMSEWMIALTIVAAGTSAPEVATSLIATLKGRHGMSIGNLLGSDLFNLLGVLGAAGTLRSMSITPDATHSIYLLAGMCIITVIFMRTDWKISKLEGLILVAIAAIRWGQSLL